MHGQTSIKEILFYVSSHFHFMIQNFKSQVAFTHQVFARKCQHIFVAISSVKAHCQPTSNRWDSVCFRNMECIFSVLMTIEMTTKFNWWPNFFFLQICLFFPLSFWISFHFHFLYTCALFLSIASKWSSPNL